MTAAIVAIAGVVVVGRIAVADTASSASAYVSISPYRVFDTRTASNAPLGPVAGDATFDVQITGTPLNVPIPADATAVVVNLTYVNATGAGYVTVFPAGEPRPTVSNLNKVGPGPVPNLVIVKLGVGGRVSVFNQGSASDLIGDVAGYYVGATGSGATGPIGPSGAAGADGTPGAPGAPGAGLPGSSCTVNMQTGVVGYDPSRANLECQSGAFGNGHVDLGEECDDGNLVNGDGCDATDHLEVPAGLNTAANAGAIGASIGPSPMAWIFVGPTSTITVRAGRRLVGSGVASIGVPSGMPASVTVGLCSQLSPMDPVAPFVTGASAVTFTVSAPKSSLAAAARSAVFASQSALTVGYCVLTSGSFTQNDSVSWWISEAQS